MNIETVVPGYAYEFEYRNHRGEVAMRRVQFGGMAIGVKEPYYLEPTLMFVGFDIDKRAERFFDVSKIVGKTFRLLHR